MANVPIDISFFESALLTVTGQQHTILETQPIAGGMINNAYKIASTSGKYFLKWNENAAKDLFEKEQKGLELLTQSKCISVPKCLGIGEIGNRNFLILEYLSQSPPIFDFWEDFGHSLAQMHQCTSPSYGLDHDNHIGKLPQKNQLKDDWIDFLIENRLNVQIDLALHNQYMDIGFAKKFQILYAQLPALLPNEPASLLHGDLWTGNFMTGSNGKAWVFDPAVYFGHREMEIAFTQLFGGFDHRFYQSYDESYSLVPGFEERVGIYQLYPLLVHVNLFGPSYLSGIKQILHRFL